MKVIITKTGATPVIEMEGLTPLESLLGLQSLKATSLKTTTLEIQVRVLEVFKKQLLETGVDSMEILPSGADFTDKFNYTKGTKDTRKKALDELVEMGVLTKPFSRVYKLSQEYIDLFKNGFDGIAIGNVPSTSVATANKRSGKGKDKTDSKNTNTPSVDTPKTPTEEEVKIIELLKDGKSMTAIADELGVHKGTISRRIKKLKERGIIVEDTTIEEKTEGAEE